MTAIMEKQNVLPVMTQTHLNLVKILNYHMGRDSAITCKKIREKYEEWGFGKLSARKFRELKFELNTIFGFCVCSGDTGYFMANSWQEVEEQEAYMYSFIRNMSHEVKVLKANYAKSVVNSQLKLF